MDEAQIPLCNSHELVDGGLGVPFDVVYAGQTCRAFAIRHQGRARAFLNRCTHVAMELDFQPNRFMDDSGRFIICATHGALYDPDTGVCKGGPGRGGLIPIALTECDGVVHWHTSYILQPVSF
jgi:nitrite reductase/ring-hydroxylating ferredoxin subunit